MSEMYGKIIIVERVPKKNQRPKTPSFDFDLHVKSYLLAQLSIYSGSFSSGLYLSRGNYFEHMSSFVQYCHLPSSDGFSSVLAS
jgi:hypothetical protein